MRFLKITFLVFSLVFCFNQQASAAEVNSNDDIISAPKLQNSKKVKFSNLENVIIENIKLNIASDDFYGLKNVTLNKRDSLKKFSLLQAESSNIQDEYSLQDFIVDEVKQTFAATLKHEAKNLIVDVKGKFVPQVEVPVTASNLSKDSVITEDDIKIKLVDKARLKQQVITTPDRLIGKKLTRTLTSGTAISFKDIEEPITIKKGKTATVIFKMKNIELKTIAEALENGSNGQIIKFKNTNSDKIINAMVAEDGTAIANYSNVAELADSGNAIQKAY